MTDTSLDDLFKEAKAALRNQVAAKAKVKACSPAPDTEGIYRNPANWIRGRGIALVHAETQTLLGNFTEYRHRLVADARRLVREVPAPPVEVTEYIHGDWWMIPEEVPLPKRLWKERRLLTLPVADLPHLGVWAKDLSVYAVFGEGSLDRVDLASNSIFGGGSVLLNLSAGTDIKGELLPEVLTYILTQLNQPL